MDGTSQAAPCVTGVVCLMLQKKPHLTPAQICEALETSAKKLSDTKSNDYGSGCVNAVLALREIEDYNNITGIDDNIYNNISIYPNPVDDILSIETETQIDEIAIYDIYGRQALSQRVNKSTSQQVVDVANLKAGVYFIKIKTDKENIVKRFVKN